MEWATPREFFRKLDSQFNFTLDPCAKSHNALCSKYFTPDDDGLIQDWSGNKVFVNPPYGRGIGNWVKKAYEEGCKDDTTVVMLIPARTDTKYWHDYAMKAEEIRLIKGRLKFGGGKNSAPFPSAVVVFDGPEGDPVENPPKLAVM
ncbi:MAG: adenine methyltransferase [Gammaproteobacteria bacterium]|nr:adenine methyltransferase [Gammaproteobacteria bacterium]